MKVGKGSSRRRVSLTVMASRCSTSFGVHAGSSYQVCSTFRTRDIETLAHQPRWTSSFCKLEWNRVIDLETRPSLPTLSLSYLAMPSATPMFNTDQLVRIKTMQHARYSTNSWCCLQKRVFKVRMPSERAKGRLLASCMVTYSTA
jgi:hypothetical protein